MYIVQVCGYLNSKSWETRVAAGQAVEAIAKNVKKWQPPKIESDSSDGKESPPPDKEEDLMSFNTFDIKQVSILARSYLSSHAHIQIQSPSHTHTHTHTQVLTHGTTLLSSTGEEFHSLDNDPEYLKMSPQVTVTIYKDTLN